jgi:hypothetical protein
LPMSPGAGAMAFASNGRKPSETAGVGSGVGVFYDGARWISVCSGLPVVAVAVGNRVTPAPPQRSRRAAFPHRAPIEGRT